MSEPDPKEWSRRILKTLKIDDKRVSQVVIELDAENIAIHTTRHPTIGDMEQLEQELAELAGE